MRKETGRNQTVQQKKIRIVEVCCGSFYDVKQAAAGGADRIELNSALALGGLTPSTATLRLVKEYNKELPVMAMVRPRGAGFCYLQEELQVMEEECLELLKNGADGIVFGCLRADASLDIEAVRRLLTRIKEFGKKAVFHRAFDCAANPFVMIEQLISLGVDRVLTSGQRKTAPEGAGLIGRLQEQYGRDIELVAGSGVWAGNVEELIEKTGVFQVHSSCKTWLSDPTTIQNGVSYQIADDERVCQYDVVSAEAVRRLVKAVHKI